MPKVKRAKTGNIPLRKAIPEDVRHVFGGKWEIKKTLPRTMTDGEAKAAAAAFYGDLEAKIAAVRAGKLALSNEQIDALAARWYRDERARELATGEPPDAYEPVLSILVGHEGGMQSPTIAGLMHKRAVETLQHHNIPADPESIDRFAEALLPLHTALYSRAQAVAQGELRPDPQDALSSASEPPKGLRAHDDERGLHVMALFDMWASHPEQHGKAATIKSYRYVFKAFAALLDNPHAKTITASDVRRYLEDRTAAGLSLRTIRDGHRAALSSVFGWADRHELVDGNPVTARTRIKAPKRRRLRDKGFTDVEAASILRAARAVRIMPRDRFRLSARRWVPVLCAYTGARVQEITQLRKQDVKQHATGFWYLHLTPDAGTIKDHDARDVPLHPHVVSEGFVAFKQDAPQGPLFYDPRTRRNASAQAPLAENTAKNLATWIRKTAGLDDRRVGPNHGWRHRLKTAAREAGVELQYVEIVAGHPPRTVGEGYGSYRLTALYREVCKITPELVEGVSNQA